MAYDQELAARIGDLLAAEPGLEEQPMFGGLAFLIRGNLALAVSGRGDLLVRVGPEASDRLARATEAEVAVMRGRPMTGWLRVPAGSVAGRRQLGRWVQAAAAFTRSLPPKPGR